MHSSKRLLIKTGNVKKNEQELEGCELAGHVNIWREKAPMLVEQQGWRLRQELIRNSTLGKYFMQEINFEKKIWKMRAFGLLSF